MPHSSVSLTTKYGALIVEEARSIHRVAELSRLWAKKCGWNPGLAARSFGKTRIAMLQRTYRLFVVEGVCVYAVSRGKRAVHYRDPPRG